MGDRVVGAVAHCCRSICWKGSSKQVTARGIAAESVKEEAVGCDSTCEERRKSREGVLKRISAGGRKEAGGRGNRGMILNRHMSGRQCFHSGAVILRWVKGLNVPDRKAEALGTCFDIVGHPNRPPKSCPVEKAGGVRGVAPRPVGKEIEVKPITYFKAGLKPPCSSAQVEE